jgi:hypothetical protein
VVHAPPAGTFPAFSHERVVAPGAKEQALPVGQPHCGETSLHGISEQTPLEVLVVLAEVVEPPAPPLPGPVELDVTWLAPVPIEAPVPIMAPEPDVVPVVAPAPTPDPPTSPPGEVDPVAHAASTVTKPAKRKRRRIGEPPAPRER